LVTGAVDGVCAGGSQEGFWEMSCWRLGWSLEIVVYIAYTLF